MSEPCALRLDGIEKTYGKGGPGEVRVLAGATLEVAQGEVVALTAPSGAGKSTLLHVAGLLDRADAGRVEIGGRDATGLGDRARRSEVGFVYQFHHLMQEFSALENVMLPQLAAGRRKRDARARAMALLDAIGLAPRADHRPAELSGGEAQRVAICRGLANRPRLLLADEPTGNLDPDTAERVFALLLGLARDEGLGALIATHNLDLASRMDRRLRLDHGVVTPAR